MTSSTPFTAAFICTGNRFRSPLAAALLAADGTEVPVAASSAGVLELGAVGALPEAVALAKPLGVDLGGHRARPLTELDLGALDLVVGFERIHVQTAVVDGGARIERTFTLPELVALLEAVPEPSVAAGAAEQARARVAQAHALRPPTFRRDTVPEIRDPLGRSDAEQRRIATVVRDQVHDLARLLFS